MDLLQLARMAFALLAVLAMIGLLGIAAKKLQARATLLGRKKRLALIESLALDSKRRAAILRCDGRDHLIVLGPTSELLIETQPALAEDAAAAPTPVVPLLRQTLAQMRREPVVSKDAA